MISGIKKIFWIDSMEDNQDIQKILSTNLQENLKFFSFKDLRSAFEEMAKINFEVIFVVVRENNYKNYYSILNDVKAHLSCLPISIIYTPTNSINLNNSYGFCGTINSREKLIVFIRNFINSINEKIKLNPKTGVKLDYNNALTFEKIKSKDDLIIPSLYTLYKKIEGKENVINNEEIYGFNHVLVNNHFDRNISHLIVPFNDVKKIPLEIATKFWIRYYTCENSFYHYMNAQLMKNIPENYDTFIKAMYKGIENKSLKSEYNIRLYRCSKISCDEMNMLEKNLMLVYSRSFLSFSKDKEKAIGFLKKGNNYLTPVMFIVNATKLEESFASNADIEQYSFFEEKEVLFFPFSSFIVDEKINTEIINGISTKVVHLNYLGKYRKEIEKAINTLDENKIKELLSRDSKFVKDISSIQLNENKFESNQTELMEHIKKAVNKVKNDTMIQWKSEEKNKNYEIINPFKILGISQNEDYPDYRKIADFRRKIKNEKQYLSCFILDNKEKYSRIDSNFLVNKDHFYYVINNDLNNLKKLYDENKFILAQKDNKERTLLHLSVIGGYYEISEFLLKSGINYDDPDFNGRYTALYFADEKNRKLLQKFGAKIEAYNGLSLKGINTINSNDINIIDSIYNDLLAKRIVNDMINIKVNNEIIGKRLIRNQNLIANKIEIIKNWEKVFHGTKFVSIEFILNYGLNNFGEPSENHIRLGQKIDNIDDWASAIFVSPSIFYASKYSELINYKNNKWFIIIEARIKPNSFSVHESTIYGYQYKQDEPSKVEYRIQCEMANRFETCSNTDNVIVTSLIFVNKNFLENLKNYQESFIFKDKY